MKRNVILRRRFLRYLAGSSLLYSAPQINGLNRVLSGEARAQETLDTLADLIASPAEAVNVFDFAPVAQAKLQPAHWTYMSMGVDDDATLKANREGFKAFKFRPKRLVDVRNIDMSTEVLGTKLRSPIILAPTGGQKAYHVDGEVEVARAAAVTDHLKILSTMTSSPVEDVVEARGEPIWYQLYPTNDWKVTEAVLKRAERAGCPVVALTVDLPASNRERIARYRRSTNPECLACHTSGPTWSSKPMYGGLDLSKVDGPGNPGMTWDFVKRIQDTTSMQLVIKGLSTAEDASLCVEHGVKGIVVSNHGGRAEESGRSTIESLPEVIEAVSGRIPVLIDGGFRRGTDIFKGLALGASAVCIGRPYLWGLGAFGQAGVERVLQLLDRELEIVMKQAGTPSIDSITGRSVQKA